jgi:hypothetical protein
MTSARAGSTARVHHDNAAGTMSVRATRIDPFTAVEKPMARSYARSSRSDEDDLERATFQPRVSNKTYVIRTPSDYERYALQNLQQNRPPFGRTFSRQPSEESLATVSPTQEWSAH